jgi:small subunit ribosomal protein S6
VATYETIFITLPSLTDDEESALVSALAQVVSDDGGQMAAKERLGRRRLAYAIRKFEDGVYNRFLYDAEPAVPRELERRIRLSDKILRHLTVRLEPDWAKASKEQAVRDELARAEAARLAAEAAARGEVPAVPGEAVFGEPPPVVGEEEAASEIPVDDEASGGPPWAERE